jgi:hypothetical protein
MEEHVEKLEQSAQYSAERAQQFEDLVSGNTNLVISEAKSARTANESAQAAKQEAISAKNVAVQAQKEAESAKVTVEILEQYTSQFASQAQRDATAAQSYADSAEKSALEAKKIQEAIPDIREKADKNEVANAIKKTIRTPSLYREGVVLDDISPVKHTIKLEFSMFEGNISQYHVLRYGENENDNPQTYAINEDKTVDGITSLYPITTLKLIGETDNIFIAYIEYSQDTNKALENAGGSSVIVDQTYNPESKNAQSGKAVAEALTNYATKSYVNEMLGVIENGSY